MTHGATRSSCINACRSAKVSHGQEKEREAGAGTRWGDCDNQSRLQHCRRDAVTVALYPGPERHDPAAHGAGC
eukprot:641029-Rhodomonas_salina.1